MKLVEVPPPVEEKAAVFGLSTWRAVYGVVLAFFLVCVLLLTLLPRLFP